MTCDKGRETYSSNNFTHFFNFVLLQQNIEYEEEKNKCLVQIWPHRKKNTPDRNNYLNSYTTQAKTASNKKWRRWKKKLKNEKIRQQTPYSPYLVSQTGRQTERRRQRSTIYMPYHTITNDGRKSSKSFKENENNFEDSMKTRMKKRSEDNAKGLD